jgi:hypothetical protein
MIYRFIIIILFITSTANGAEKPWFPGCPASIKNSYDCAQYLEKDVLKKYPELASRDANKLIIHMVSGSTTTLIDEAVQASRTKKYSLVGVLKEIDYALIHVQYWESKTYYLVNLQTGQIEDIEGLPVVSPSNKYLVSTNFAGVSGESDPTIKIYKLSKPHLTLTWSLKPKWEPSDPKWLSDTELTLVKNIFSEDLFWKQKNEEDHYIKEKVRIVFSNGQWHLIAKQGQQN